MGAEGSGTRFFESRTKHSLTENHCNIVGIGFRVRGVFS